MVLALIPASRTARGSQAGAACRLASAPPAVWKLPDALAEVSGLAIAGDGHLLAHGDERGRVEVLHRTTGEVVRRIRLRGDPRDDFEGIAAAGDSVILMTAAGRLYLFRDRTAGEASYQVVETGLGRYCELEGLAWDRRAGVLLLPCKVARVPGLAGGLEVWRWSIAGGRVATPARISLPAAALARAVGVARIRPTAVEVDPVTGDLLVLSSRPAALLRLARSGALQAVTPLRARAHPQAEGLALTETTLYIGDEGGDRRGMVTAYSCRRSP